ncbi:hypothetical protein OIO90_002490 [Microbotryomycetes sp. JL221]|nr:hypothetical protein OIO90_002490 [Microbotryomycetes sp. JL221]
MAAPDLIQQGSHVIVYSSRSQLDSIFVQDGAQMQSRYGHFRHSDMIGKPYGCKILYLPDIAFVTSYLDIKAGSTVIEAGTGSGSFTHAIARSVGSKGTVHSFEYHEQRFHKAKQEFTSHGLDDVVRLRHRNVCKDGFDLDNQVDSIFLDLPAPWEAVKFAKAALRKDRQSRICCFSPCIEQVLRTVSALAELGFSDITMYETLVRDFEPTALVCRDVSTAIDRIKEVEVKKERRRENQIAEAQRRKAELKRKREEHEGGAEQLSQEATEHAVNGSRAAKHARAGIETPIDGADGESKPNARASNSQRQSTFRANGLGRGHTSFLTFATLLPRVARLGASGSMAPLSKPALLSLIALTLHYSVLSVVLHVSRQGSGPRYHASSAILCTELCKAALAATIVLFSGEMRPRMADRKRARLEAEEREALADLTEPAWISGNGTNPEASARGSQESHRDWLEGKEQALVTPSPRRRSSTTLRVDVALAQAKSQTAAPPTFALIPATPAPEPSPMRMLDADGLYPNRPSLLLPSSTVIEDVADSDWWRTLLEATFGRDSWKLAIVAGLFTLQNNLQYLASGNLSVPLFQLAYQLKIPATALCSVLLLNRTLSQQQWTSLFALTAGVGIVQLGSVASSSTVKAKRAVSDSMNVHGTVIPNQFIGLVAVVCACLSSGFAGCYFEKILKAPTTTAQPQRPSVWIRNVQLSLVGIATGLPVAAWEMRRCWLAESWDQALTMSWFDLFFDGFSSLTWMVILLQVTGGLLGALVIQYADNLLKCFSTSLSILLSVALSVWLFDFHVTLPVIIGSILVIASTYTYTTPASWLTPLRYRPAPAGQAHARVPSTSYLSGAGASPIKQ